MKAIIELSDGRRIDTVSMNFCLFEPEEVNYDDFHMNIDDAIECINDGLKVILRDKMLKSEKEEEK